MATARAQRIGIWVIAIVLFVGTLAGFIAIILTPKNQQSDQARVEQLSQQYQDAQKEYQAKVAAQGTELSTKYFAAFSGYASRVGAFSKDGVSELKKEDLKIGDGGIITQSTAFTAYYIGWNPDGVIFYQSIDGSSLKAPFTAQPGGVITGWTEGVDGMAIGGVRELTIPADKAYGATGSGDKIAPNTPLKFVIMVIPTPEAIAQPEIPAALLKYYTRGSF